MYIVNINMIFSYKLKIAHIYKKLYILKYLVILCSTSTYFAKLKTLCELGYLNLQEAQRIQFKAQATILIGSFLSGFS